MEAVRLYRLSGIETLRERFRAVRIVTNTYGAPLSDEDITLWLANLFTGASGFTVDIWNRLNVTDLTEESFIDDINVGTRISGGIYFYNILQDKISNNEINSTEDFKEFVTYFKNDVLTKLESKALLDQFVLDKYGIEQVSREVPTVDLDSQVYVHYPYGSETDTLAVYDLDSGVIVKTIKGSENEIVIEEDQTAESVMSQKQLEDMEHQAKKETEELQELMKRDKAVDSENKTESSENKVESVAHFGPTVKKEDRKEFDFSTAQELVLYDKQLKSKYIEIYIIGAKKYGVLGVGKLYETGRVFVYDDYGSGTWYSSLSSAYRELCTQKIGEFASCNYFKSTCDIEGTAVDNYRGNESYKQLNVMDVIQNYCLFRVDFTPIAKGLGTVELRSDELNKYVKVKDIDSDFCTYENNYNCDGGGWYTLYYIIEKMCKDKKCAINKFRVEALLKTFKPSDMRFNLSDLVTIEYERVVDGITEFTPDYEFCF